MPHSILPRKSNPTDESVHHDRESFIDDLVVVHVYQVLGNPFICLLPQRVGFYSCRVFHDGQSHRYCSDKSSLTYLRPDWRYLENLDLLEGVILKEPLKRILREAHHIFDWIIREPQVPLVNVNFVFACSVILHNILYLPYNPDRFLLVYAIKLNDTIYLIRSDPNDFAKRGIQVPKNYMINVYADMSFTDMITLQENGSPARPHVRGNRNSFYVVNKLEVGQHRILYPHHMHCAINVKQFQVPYEEMRFAGIKTQPRPGYFPQRPNQHVTRSISWWITSFLGSVETIICGEKIARTNVQRIKALKPDSLLNIRGKDPLASWNPKVCFDNLKNSLSHIKAKCTKEKVVYLLTFMNKDQGLEVSEVSKLAPSTLIPSWYLADPR